MTKKESVGLYKSLISMGHLTGVKFAYAVSKNMALLKTEIESLDKASEMSPEFKEKFEDKRLAIVEKYSKKDAEGKPVIKDGAYEIENQEEFDKEFEILKAENAEIFTAREKQINDYNELINKPSDVVLFKISLEDVPKDINVAQMYQISEMVSEEILSPFQK